MTDAQNTFCTYDPLRAFIEHYAEASEKAAPAEAIETLPIEEKLQRRIVDGNRVGLDRDLETAMGVYAPLDIINTILLLGMKTVGELFGSGRMQLPFVLQSAETMKAAVTYLEQFMEKSEGQTKGTIVLATVKGDVHDIGKNLVDIILSNNGYTVINLGIKVTIDAMLSAADLHHADAIGMSGLLVKSTVIMRDNLEYMERREKRIPVLLGGAALTRRYVENDLRPKYRGEVVYASDAFDGLAYMEALHGRKKLPQSAQISAIQSEDRVSPDGSGAGVDEEISQRNEDAFDPSTTGASMETALHVQDVHTATADAHPAIEKNDIERPVYILRSNVSTEHSVPIPPFYGSKIVTDISLESVFGFINETALFRGQWQMKRGKKSAEEYERELATVIRPRFQELKQSVLDNGIFQPAVVYGYFPCMSDREELIIFKPKSGGTSQLLGQWSQMSYTPDECEEWLRISFPRQHGDRYLCIADFFKPMNSGLMDVCAFQVVTVGAAATAFNLALFDDHKYQDYLFYHGLSVESAEALAEYWHALIRRELGIGSKDAPEMKRLFSQGYQGSRYSFGYPACPNLEDQSILFELLRPERIGVTLTEEFLLVPEQSTTALIVHHPAAKYFGIK
jgi:5-methyltetrahydrofolate--homocysteine methyltransferase